MDFYKTLVHKLYVWDTSINGTFFSNPYEFIEANHEIAQFKGSVFYENIIHALPDHFGATMRPEFFRELLSYCSSKKDGIKQHASHKREGLNNHIHKMTGLPIIDPDDIRTKYIRWTDEQFKLACNELDKLDTTARVEFLYQHNRYVSLFTPQKRTIDGKEYVYGFPITDYASAEYVGIYLINAEKGRWHSSFKENFNRRLQLCDLKSDKVGLIEEEINNIEKALQPFKNENTQIYYQKNGFAFGYLTEKTKQQWQFYHVITSGYFTNLKETHFSLLYCMDVVHGASKYLFDRELKIMLNDLTAIVSSEPIQSKNTYDITTYDKVVRELSTIDVIFKAQSRMLDPDEQFPFILNFKGVATDGRFINSMDIYSDDDLFNLQSHKQDFTQRFESAVNTALVLNQLLNIKSKCMEIVSYYETNLGANSPAVLAFRQNIPADFNLRAEYINNHSVVITIHRYQSSEIYFEAHRGKMPDFLDMSKLKYNYHVNNQDLLLICLQLIEFVDTFFGVQPKETIAAKKPEKKQFTSLGELFFEPEYYKKAISALYTIGVINDKYENKVGNPLKGVIQVWVNILRQRNKLRDISDAELTILVNSQFVGVNISEKSDGKHFRNVNRTAENKYGKKLKELLG